MKKGGPLDNFLSAWILVTVLLLFLGQFALMIGWAAGWPVLAALWVFIRWIGRPRPKRVDPFAVVAKPKAEPVKPRADHYRVLKTDMEKEIEAAMVFAEDDEEREAIREIVRAKYRDRLQGI